MNKPLKIGDMYTLEDDSPWKDRITIRAEIIDLKDGWVRYNRLNNDLSVTTDSCSERLFCLAYRKME